MYILVIGILVLKGYKIVESFKELKEQLLLEINQVIYVLWMKFLQIL